MKRFLTLPAAIILGLSLLSGCGDDGGVAGIGGADYCEELKQAKEHFDSLGSGDFDDFGELRDEMENLRDAAPDEVKDDWDVVVDGFDQIVKAFEEAGVDEDQIAAIMRGETPEGVDMQKVQEAFAKLSELDNEKFEQATDNINKHAKEECDIDLEASPSS